MRHILYLHLSVVHGSVAFKEEVRIVCKHCGSVVSQKIKKISALKAGHLLADKTRILGKNYYVELIAPFLKTNGRDD